MNPIGYLRIVRGPRTAYPYELNELVFHYEPYELYELVSPYEPHRSPETSSQSC